MSKLQDLIVSYYDENEDKAIFEKIVHEIQTCDKVWTAFSPVTKNHFVDYVQGRPTAFLFSEKEYCTMYCEHMKESGFEIGCAECSKENRLGMFADYHRSGFECVIVDNGKRYIFMELTELINIPDFKNEPEENRPMINPALVCSADRFFQCLAANAVSPDKELNMLVDTYYAKYIIPVVGEIKDNSATIPGLERSDGHKVVPFFTDVSEYRKFDPNGKFNMAMSDFTQIESLCNSGETVVVNPMGFNLTMTKKHVDAVRRAINSVPNNGKAERAVIFSPDRVPKALIDGLNVILDNTDGVMAGYVMGMRKNNESQYLVVIDCGENDSEKTTEIMNSVKEIAGNIETKEKVEYLPASSSIGQAAIANAEPFFRRYIVNMDEEE